MSLRVTTYEEDIGIDRNGVMEPVVKDDELVATSVHSRQYSLIYIVSPTRPVSFLALLVMFRHAANNHLLSIKNTDSVLFIDHADVKYISSLFRYPQSHTLIKTTSSTTTCKLWLLVFADVAFIRVDEVPQKIRYLGLSIQFFNLPRKGG